LRPWLLVSALSRRPSTLAPTGKGQGAEARAEDEQPQPGAGAARVEDGATPGGNSDTMRSELISCSGLREEARRVASSILWATGSEDRGLGITLRARRQGGATLRAGSTLGSPGVKWITTLLLLLFSGSAQFDPRIDSRSGAMLQEGRPEPFASITSRTFSVNYSAIMLGIETFLYDLHHFSKF
jgi:hypothetical protein